MKLNQVFVVPTIILASISTGYCRIFCAAEGSVSGHGTYTFTAYDKQFNYPTKGSNIEFIPSMPLLDPRTPTFVSYNHRYAYLDLQIPSDCTISRPWNIAILTTTTTGNARQFAESTNKRIDITDTNTYLAYSTSAIAVLPMLNCTNHLNEFAINWSAYDQLGASPSPISPSSGRYVSAYGTVTYRNKATYVTISATPNEINVRSAPEHAAEVTTTLTLTSDGPICLTSQPVNGVELNINGSWVDKLSTIFKHDSTDKSTTEVKIRVKGEKAGVHTYNIPFTANVI